MDPHILVKFQRAKNSVIGEASITFPGFSDNDTFGPIGAMISHFSSMFRLLWMIISCKLIVKWSSSQIEILSL